MWACYSYLGKVLETLILWEISHSVLASPLTSSRRVLGLVTLVDVCDFRHKRIIRVGVGQKRTNREKDLRDCQCRGPLILEDIKTDGTVGVDVGVVDTSLEGDLWGLEGVVGREVDVEEEDAASVG